MKSMILEGLVTTLDPTGRRTSPRWGRGWRATSRASRCARSPPRTRTRTSSRHRQGVLHVTDDALLLAKAAIGAVDVFPPVRPAERVRGVVLARFVPALRVRGDVDGRSAPSG